MSDTQKYLSVLGLVAAVMLATFAAGFFNAPRLGLDLQGGLEVVLEARPKKGESVSTEDIDRSVEVIRNRVDQLGVAETQIRPQGSNQISIALPGVGDADNAAEVIGSTAQLRFYDLQEYVVDEKVYRSAYDALKPNQRLVKDGNEDFLYLFDEDHELIAGPVGTEEELLEEFGGVQSKTTEILAVPEGYVLLHGDPDGLTFTFGQPEEGEGRFDPNLGVYLMMEDKAALTGEAIDIANATSGGGRGAGGGWATEIQFSGQGSDDFEAITKELAQRGRIRQNNQNFAIVLDDELVSAPTIDYAELPNGISGGQAQITGLDDQQEAQELALVLNTGSLPVNFEIVSKTEVSATLGKASLRQGLLAGAVGLSVVLIYMVLFYRFLGLIANVALLMVAFILYGVIVTVPIVLTLPGIAGMILTIGIAADASIVIFERIRDEYRNGRSVRAATRTGYQKGISTILDANVVTLITAGVLFLLGSAGVRGFALTLFIGILLSLFIAVAFAYSALGLLARYKWFGHSWVIGGTRKAIPFAYHWVRHRNRFFVVSGVFVVVAFGTLAAQGLNLGIDFKSGTKVIVAFKEDISTDDLRTQLDSIDGSYAAANIQETSAPAGSDSIGASSFQIQLDELAAAPESGSGGSSSAADDATASNADQAASEAYLEEQLDEAFGVETIAVQTIGASFGRQILLGALLAIFVSVILESAYIWSRFEWKFAIPVVIAMAHDLLIAVGAYALSGREFTSATVAALLTILGYSLYDTIIVFDRIRENTRTLRKASWARITDTSLNEVLTRSINTSISTMLPVLTIFFFGGETLKDFAWALVIGIIAGAYSSLFVAAPVLSMLKEKEDFWRRRKGTDDDAPVRTGGTKDTVPAADADKSSTGAPA